MPDEPANDLQFQRAEPLTASGAAIRRCAACQQIVPDKYYHAQGQVVCPTCAERIKAGQQAPPTSSLFRAFLYGLGAAVAGCAIYAAVSIATGYEFALMAIVVGVMVGKAIRYASHGLGGRPQQILAVALTYFGITTSYVPVAIHSWSTHTPGASIAQVDWLHLMGLSLAAPFLSIGSGISGLLTLFIIFVGLAQAWKLTRASDILILGPYNPQAR